MKVEKIVDILEEYLLALAFHEVPQGACLL